MQTIIELLGMIALACSLIVFSVMMTAPIVKDHEANKTKKDDK